MVDRIVAPPAMGGDTPDNFTAKNPDYTGDHAQNRVLHINTRILRYGTDDKAHAAALILSVSLLFSAILVVLVGIVQLITHSDSKWLETVLTWIGNAFLFTSGIAVGRGGSGQPAPKSD